MIVRKLPWLPCRATHTPRAPSELQKKQHKFPQRKCVYQKKTHVNLRKQKGPNWRMEEKSLFLSSFHFHSNKFPVMLAHTQHTQHAIYEQIWPCLTSLPKRVPMDDFFCVFDQRNVMAWTVSETRRALSHSSYDNKEISPDDIWQKISQIKSRFLQREWNNVASSSSRVKSCCPCEVAGATNRSAQVNRIKEFLGSVADWRRVIACVKAAMTNLEASTQVVCWEIDVGKCRPVGMWSFKECAMFMCIRRVSKRKIKKTVLPFREQFANSSSSSSRISIVALPGELVPHSAMSVSGKFHQSSRSDRSIKKKNNLVWCHRVPVVDFTLPNRSFLSRSSLQQRAHLLPRARAARLTRKTFDEQENKRKFFHTKNIQSGALFVPFTQRGLSADRERFVVFAICSSCGEREISRWKRTCKKTSV